MHRFGLVVTLALFAGCRSTAPELRGAPGDPRAEGRTGVRSSATLLVSVPGETVGVEDYIGGVGLERFVRRGLALGGELGLHAIDGVASDGGDYEAKGLSAGASLRWHPLATRGWSPFVELGVGLLATSEAFPEGGTNLNALRHTGVGVEFDLTEHLRLAAGLRQQHVSNGKGQVADNPTWESQGAYVALSFDVTPRDARQLDPRGMTVPAAEPWSVRLDARGGEYASDDTGGGAVLALDTRVYRDLFAQVRGSLDSTDGETLREFGAALYVRGARGRAGLAVDRQELDVFADDEFTLFGEWLANDITTVSSVLGHERRNQAADRAIAGLSLRIYALDNLAIDAGMGMRATSAEFGADSFRLPFGLEFAPAPKLLPGFSLFAQRDLDDRGTFLGLRWILSPSAASFSTLRERDYSSGPLRLRP
jgi:hypothetical protein